ncbi:hypothetical protein TUM20985_37140 [Mycobacterium antarcticum]|uniref:cupin domain-containing protein n=1 Tax=unclassified Mycolicibacterium TaxID=2636767 RepID=UPI002395E478|nr:MULTISPECIES: cupin domain-containing protein [unclassified Mycolicibacterium]BDX33167.1 hypothetical protein TUM20985_37140 [Mycolicibacterium sp. TUM20985]GLP76342.1 hypothetical protein TUM20983_34520 [Mycolicibacterium sp. TUM20983]
MTNRPIEVCQGQGPELLDATIDPDWILEGTPKSRSSWWCGSADRMANHYVWDCTAGRFRWYFDRDETVYVIEGEVEVSGEGVPPTWLRAGDAALFRAGTWSTWHVPQYVRKHAIIRRGLPAPLRLLVECARRAKQLIGSRG